MMRAMLSDDQASDDERIESTFVGNGTAAGARGQLLPTSEKSASSWLVTGLGCDPLMMLSLGAGLVPPKESMSEASAQLVDGADADWITVGPVEAVA